MKKNDRSKKVTNRNNGKAYRRDRRRSDERLGFECLEGRRMMALIVWENRADFDNELGADTARARVVINQAILDWQLAIDSFNYRNVGSPGYYSLTVNVENLESGAFADCLPTEIDGDGKPYAAELRIDDNAAGRGWWYDSTPWEDSEFTTPTSPFSARQATRNRTDMYSVVLHEIGHGLGFSWDDDIRIHDYVGSNGTMLLNDLTSAYLVEIAAHTSDTSHPNDLMNPTYNAARSERKTISQLDGMILERGLGYTINWNNIYARSFVATQPSGSRTLTVHGDLGTRTNPRNDVTGAGQKSDEITISDTFVIVNGIRKEFNFGTVDTIKVEGKLSGDTINVERTSTGRQLQIDAGPGSNIVRVGANLKNLTFIQGNIDISEDGGTTRVNFLDDNFAASRTFTISARDVRFSGVPGVVRYGDYGFDAQNTDRLSFYGGSRGNTYDVESRSANQTFMSINSGLGNDTVKVRSVGARGIDIYGGSGTDSVVVGAFGINGMNEINGRVIVHNSAAWINLTLDDSADNVAFSDVRVEGSRVTGMSPAPVFFHPSGVPGRIKSLKILASNSSAGRGNEITVLDTPQNETKKLVVDISTGQFDDNVFVRRTSSQLNIEGQDGRDDVFIGFNGLVQNITKILNVSNNGGYSSIYVDNSLDTSRRTLTLSASGLRLANVSIFYDERDLEELRVFGGSGVTTATISDTPQNLIGTTKTTISLGAAADKVTVRGTTGQLLIYGGGSAENVVAVGASGRLNAIRGAIDVVNNLTAGYTHLIVDGSQESDSQTVQIDSQKVHGLAPADIRYDQTKLASLEVFGGMSANTFTIQDTPQNNLNSTLFLVNSGIAADTVNVQRTKSTTYIKGQSGADVVNVGLAGNMQSITKELWISNSGSYSRINLDDSNDTQGRAITMDVSSTIFGVQGRVAGLSPAPIYYKASDLQALNVLGTNYLDYFLVKNTALSGIEGGSPTTIETGDGADTVRVAATEGALNLDFDGSQNLVTIGSDGGMSASLNSISGPIAIRSSNEVQSNFLEILDRSSTSNYKYTLENGSFGRTKQNGSAPIAPIDFSQYPLQGLLVVGADRGNSFVVKDTPSQNNVGPSGGFTIRTGQGNDAVNVWGAGFGPLNIDLGAGAIQSIAIGDATHSLDNIRSDVRVSGSGTVIATISDAASTTKHWTRFDAIGDTQYVARLNSDTGQQLNNFALQASDRGRILYQAGGAVAGTNNQIDVNSVRSNIDVDVLGGPGNDVFTAGSSVDTRGILGSVNFFSPHTDNDFAILFDRFNPSSQSYEISTNPIDNSGVRVERTEMPTIVYNGVAQLDLYSPTVGGNATNIRSLPASVFLNIAAANRDALNVGSAAPGLGGTMENVAGKVLVASYGGSSAAVALTLDDSGNTSVARDVTIEEANVNGPMGVVTGLTGSQSLFFRDYANYTVDIRGGSRDDSFVMSGPAFSAKVSIDGGAGNDILVGSGGNRLFGGAGRDLLVAGALASVLNGGLDEDILIGGTIDDVSLSNLNQIRSVWTGDLAHDSRVSVLQDTRLTSNDVHGNDEVDRLTGGLDALDLFFGELDNPDTDVFDADLLTDFDESESLVTMP